MITGYNTDVEHGGVVYHVQTEDKGLDSPLILSLVYTGGAILASKRSPYDDLISAGFDEHKLSERLQRQHKLICAAIHSGRIEDLKRMGQREQETLRAARPIEQKPAPPVRQEQKETDASQPLKQTVAPPALSESQTLPANTPGVAPITPERTGTQRTGALKGQLYLDLLEDRLLRAGEMVIFRVRVSSGTVEERDAVPDAEVTLKVLGTSFRPQISSARTDPDGIAMLFASLPRFTTGRAAVLIRATAQAREVELRRIIQPA
ncbi:MAG TPA: hypothetical protein VGB17_07190 [Pyrinomonadaceae bacterium]